MENLDKALVALRKALTEIEEQYDGYVQQIPSLQNKKAAFELQIKEKQHELDQLTEKATVLHQQLLDSKHEWEKNQANIEKQLTADHVALQKEQDDFDHFRVEKTAELNEREKSIQVGELTTKSRIDWAKAKEKELKELELKVNADLKEYTENQQKLTDEVSTVNRLKEETNKRMLDLQNVQAKMTPTLKALEEKEAHLSDLGIALNLRRKKIENFELELNNRDKISETKANALKEREQELAKRDIQLADRESTLRSNLAL